MVLKQDIGTLMGTDSALSLSPCLSLFGKTCFSFFSFFCFFELKHVSNHAFKKSTRAYKYHASIRFTDDLYAMNDHGEVSKFFRCIYPRELGLKLEQSETHATFLHLDIKIEDGIVVYKLFDKRDRFPLFIVPIPHFGSNIPSTRFYGSVFSYFLRIARCTLKLEHFLPSASELYSRMLSQRAN